MSLIVIHRNNPVETCQDAFDEQRVRREGPFRVDTLRAQLRHGRLCDLFVLRSHVAVFTGMRIDRGDADFRMGDSFRPDRAAEQAGGFHNPFPGGEFCYVLQRDMGGYESHAQRIGGLHHGEIGRSAEFRNQFGVTGEGNTRQIDGRLVDRSCDNGIDFSGESIQGCSADGFISLFAAERGERSE